MTTLDDVLIGLEASRRAGWARAYAAEERVAELELELARARVRVDALERRLRTTGPEPWKPTLLMEKVCREVERSALYLTRRAVLDLVRGKPALIREAITRLEVGGYLRREQRAGVEVLVLVRPYRAEP